MAIIVSENFDSYANGDNLNTKNGGSGWSGAWSTSGTVTCSNVQSQTSSLSIRKNTNAYSNGQRTFSGIKDSKITFYVYRVSTAADNFELLYASSTNSIRFRVKSSTDWNIDLNGVAQSNQSGWANNVWKKVEIAINQTAGTVGVSIDQGVPVSYSYTNSGNNFTDVYPVFPTGTNDELYFDSFTVDNDLTFDRDKGNVNPALLLNFI